MPNNFQKHERETETRGRRTGVNPVDEAVNISKDEVKAAIVSGVVTDCLKLNVRKEPSADAEVLVIINALDNVMVDTDASSDAFYKVVTAAGVEGFCMRKYIALKK